MNIIDKYVQESALNIQQYNKDLFEDKYSKLKVVEIKNSKLIIQFEYDKSENEQGINMAVPHNIVDVFQFEDNPSLDIKTKNVVWRWFWNRYYSSTPVVKESIGGWFSNTNRDLSFEALEGGKPDNKGFSTKNDVLKDNLLHKKKNNSAVEILPCDVSIHVLYDDTEGGWIRQMGYEIFLKKRSKYIRGNYIPLVAKDMTHDYVEYLCPKKVWNIPF
jgi:hypothetical protein